tara:strand:+ start:1003 stop:1341 length:339 start_codon:yes stop_codon:yes gene_type:complete
MAKSKLKKFLKKAGKAAAAGVALYGASKMFGKKPGMESFSKDPFARKGISLATGDASAAESMAKSMREKNDFMSKMSKIASAGGVSKLKAGSKTTVMAKGCKLGRKRRTIIT